MDTADQGMGDARERIETLVGRFLTPRTSEPTKRDLDLIGEGEPIELECGLAATSWGSGPTVLLAHGWESRRSHWGAFVTALAPSGFRVVAIDAPAHGDSPGSRTHVVEYARKLVDVGREIGPTAGIVGHSWGAGATILALREGLVADRAVLLSGFASVRSISERWARGRDLSDAEVHLFLDLLGKAVGVPVDDLELTRVAAELDRPVLIVHDHGDEDIPVEQSVALGAAWPGARVHLTNRFGHRRILMAKEVVREVAGFLRDER